MSNVGVYVASRVVRAEMWRRIRAEDGYKITSSWIDESGPGETANLGELWERIEREVSGSERLVLYVEPQDFPLKGALVEIGMALAHRIPIRICSPGVLVEETSYRPLGSWVAHPLVKFSASLRQAFFGCTVDM